MEVSSDEHFEELLHNARSGSQAALTDLLAPYQSMITAYAESLLGKDVRKYMDSHDLTQDVFVVATGSILQFRGSTEKAWISWLKGICRNCFLNFLRDRAPKIRATQSLQGGSDRSSHIDVLALQTSIFGRVEQRHHESLFERVLAWLPENDRLLLAKKYMGTDEVAWQELVEEFGISEVALRRRGSRLIELLRGGIRLLEKIDHQRIPPALADLLCMKFLQRLSVQEIAERSGEPVDKVKCFLAASEELLRESES